MFWDLADPCPASGNPTAHYNTWQTNSDGSIDYPDFIYDELRDRGGFVFRQNYPNGPNNPPALYAGYLDAANANFWYWPDTCPSALSHVVTSPRAAFDSNGDMHIVYAAADLAGFSIRTTIFHPDTHSFECNSSTADVKVDSYSSPTDANGNLSWCSTKGTVAALNAISNNSLKIAPSPDIAIDRFRVPNDMVVTFSTSGSGSCKGYYEGRWYYSNQNGANNTWFWQTGTGCQDSVHMQVSWDWVSGYGGKPARFHTIAEYSNSLNTNWLAANDFPSTDYGNTFGPGTALGAANYIPGAIIANSCYWGDYNAASADPAGNQYLYAWGTPKAAPLWYVEGYTNSD